MYNKEKMQLCGLDDVVLEGWVDSSIFALL